ncbi:unnamed protein product, partial [Owenia fusiformis]
MHRYTQHFGYKDFIHLSVVLLLQVTYGISQERRTFPPLFNAGEIKPVSTVPSQSTCGIPVRSAHCKSSTFMTSISECRQELCEQNCPQRTTLPSHFDFLLALNYGPCVITDTVNVRPGSTGQYSAVFSAGDQCYLSPLTEPSLGANGAFTVAFWIWQEPENIGTVMEKASEGGASIVRIRVSTSKLMLTLRTSVGGSEVHNLDSIPPRTWMHVAIQVYATHLSFYLNGLGVGYSARNTAVLPGQVQDGPGITRLGQRVNGQDQYEGRLQDFRFYDETLTNREIEAVYSGNFPDVHIQSNCRCPSSHPRIKPLHDRYCIRNGVPDNTGDESLRLNDDAHPLEYLNDGDSNSIWVSAILDDTTITIDLLDQYQVFYVVLQFYSPQPKIVTIERRRTNTSEWETWQLYAEDCQLAFGQPNNGPLETPTSTNCIQFPTNPAVPSSKGNITLNLLAPEPVPRPGYNDFYNTPELFDFVRAAQVRVRLQDHYYVTNTRHRYFGLYEFIVTARCNCHGHAETCDTTQPTYKCNCLPSSNTEGNQCDTCKALYNDKPFYVGDPFNTYDCKACQCYNHATSCVYDVNVDPFPDEYNRGGGGVCVDCQHNTQGRRCDSCITNYFRETDKSLFAEDVCTACDCFTDGVAANITDCEKVGGQCSCKANVGGRTCDSCKDGFYNLEGSNLDGCNSCNCETSGTVNGDVKCHQTTAQCNCKPNVRGLHCDACNYGYFHLNASDPLGCSPCQCNPQGSTSQFCNPDDGQCLCKENVIGVQCDQCVDGFWDFDNGCQPCGCNEDGTVEGTTCEKSTGQCICKENAMGLKCDECRDTFYDLGSDPARGCLPCNCDVAGSVNGSSFCNKINGTCECKRFVTGLTCNQCVSNTWNLTEANEDGCIPCGCDPTGTEEGATIDPSDLVCNQNTGQCACLSSRIGRTCNDCSRGYYVNNIPGGGCFPCGCSKSGTVRFTACDSQTGQCSCREGNSGVAGRACDSCKPTYNKFSPGAGTCSPCECSPSGSTNDTCHFQTGQCNCKEFVTGQKCDECVPESSNLDAENPQGCSKTPSQQPPPTSVAKGPRHLSLKWMPPDYPNGPILMYKLYRNGRMIVSQDPNVLQYEDTGLEPNTDYTYVIAASNIHGSVRSPPVTFRTPPAAPTGDLGLKATNIGAKTASFEWHAPPGSNGAITSYKLYSYNPFQSYIPYFHFNTTNGDVTSAVLNDLTAYTNYTFILRASTNGGSLDSEPVIVMTHEAIPEDQREPNITPVSSSSLFVQWDHPTRPNGIIIFYELWLRGLLQPNGERDPETIRVFHAAGQYNPNPGKDPEENALAEPATNFTIHGLEPYTQYELQVLCENSVGKAASLWVGATTLEELPLSTPTPTVVAYTSSQFNISWLPPIRTEARGVILEYRIYVERQTDTLANPFAPPIYHEVIYTGNSTSYIADGFKPYSSHTFHVGACNSIGCVNSSTTTQTTLAAAPSEPAPPSVSGYNASTMSIKWDAPQEINGPDPTYHVERAATAFNHPPPTVEKGTRFPGGGYYKFKPDTVPQSVTFTGIEIEFRTWQRDGLLMFAASEGNQEEFFAIQLSKGRPWFLFDPQGCYTWIEPDPELDGNVTYSDGEWHQLKAQRSGTDAYISVDGNEGTKVGTCATGTIIGPNTGVYIGGLPKDFVMRRKETDKRANVVRQSFQGCLGKITIVKQEVPVEIKEELKWEDAILNHQASPTWEGCPINLQDGIHFLGRGFLAITTYSPPTYKFRGGKNFHITFDLRTNFRSGLLFFGHGVKDVYFYGELIDGNIHFVFSNGVVDSTVTYPNNLISACNGDWLNVNFTKSGSELSIQVNKESPVIGQGDPQVLAIVVMTSSFYVGGIPNEGPVADFVSDHGLSLQDGFGGCIRNLYLNDKANTADFMTLLADIDNVNLDGCPSQNTNTTVGPCGNNHPSEIYSGPGKQAFDNNLEPFTDYIYRTIAENHAGSSSSNWAGGRTKEGAPTGVYSPTNVEAVTGYIISAEWQAPSGQTGLLKEYRLRGHDLDRGNGTMVETSFNISTFAGEITTAIPYTNYSVHLVACTAGGCTESVGVNVLTKEEAPEEVSVPTAEVGPTYLYMKWTLPAKPNGVITGYFLYRDNLEVYSGGEMAFNVTNLNVYVGYEFYVRACTKVGCSNGPSTTISTAQLPPSFVDKPALTVLGTKRVFVEWSRPAQLNGALKRYLLYVSTLADSHGEVRYNSSDFFLDYTLEGLNAGSTYYIRVAACTGGGCTKSEPSLATTEESAPEDVFDPTWTSPSPSELYITWQIPGLPNGNILKYELYQNGLMVFSNATTREYRATGLEPYSLHTLRVVACTAKGCGSSNEVQARTMEAPPIGTVVLEMRVNGPRSVSVRWNPPSVPNGRVYFDIYFQGLYYRDADNWDYSTVRERRSLHRTETSGRWVEIDTLISDSIYSIQANASNTKGFIISNTQVATMPPGAPDGVRPPVLVSPSPTQIRATWQQVGRANARQQPLFQLQFRHTFPGAIVEDLFAETTTATTFLKEGLNPYTEYQMRLVASNTYGQTNTEWVSLYTMQDKPSSIDPPMTGNIQARQVDVIWEQPARPNGIIMKYNIYINNIFREVVPGNLTRWTVTKLTPYSTYIFKIEACTVAGCSISADSRPVQTFAAAPEGVARPTLISETPTSVLVQWTSPSSPNGILQGYTLQRKDFNSTIITDIEQFGPTASKRYVDEDKVLTPYTVYEYRVGAISGPGTTYSPWTPVTTKPSNPGGLSPPIVRILGPRSMEVKWQPPIQSNGQLELYIVKLPAPSVELRNLTQLMVVVEDLIPFTEYFVTVTACNEAACTESGVTKVTTDPTLPEGQGPPDVTPISQTYIYVLWQRPERPNGPGLRYEVDRRKISQPLDSSATNFLSWESVYTGAETFYEDRGLSIFTTFNYRVTVYNDYGQVTSVPSIDVTTFGGVPTKSPIVSAYAISHVAISFNWTLPSVVELQGSVSEYQLKVLGGEINKTLTYIETDTMIIVNELEPSTRYTLTLTSFMHGGATISSTPAIATTLDGAPEGLSPPQLIVVDDTTLQVLWSAPARPNGDVIAYFIHLDDKKIDTGLTVAGSFMLYKLQPHTVYSVQVEVCTVYACLKSNATYGTTAEAIPQELSKPLLDVLSPYTIDISWTSPVKPNGIITKYDLLRRHKEPCENQVEESEPQATKCTYIQCDARERLCDTTCYSGPKTCCNGVLHDNKQDYVCCGSSYLPLPLNDTAVCCGEQFYNYLDNHQCCHDKYLEVLPGEICCPDSSQDREDIGFGDTCCGSIPFLSSGAQICCNGKLYDKHNQQCCGDTVQPATMICCGNSTYGQAYAPLEGASCCGAEYKMDDVSVCCSDTLGRSKVHTYSSADGKANSNEVCCSLERISTSLSCCNGMGYSAFTQTCADVSNMEPACGSGRVCPISQQGTAFCDRCDFDRTSHYCGSVPGYYNTSPTTPPSTPAPGTMCYTTPEKLFTGMGFRFTDTGLVPFTSYEYSVVVSNRAGSSSSGYTEQTTLQTVPGEVLAPQARVEPGITDTIHLSWEPPVYPNGEITHYILKRDNVEIYRGTRLTLVDNNTIRPYQMYAYTLQACTVVGCAMSPLVKVSTLQARPENVSPPDVIAISPTSLLITWNAPGRANGILSRYILSEATLGEIYNSEDVDTRRYTLTDLDAYGQYELMLTACTEAGCQHSDNVTIRTQETTPQ